MSFDRRTGKPVAISVMKVDPTSVSPEILNDEKVQGTIVQEAKLIKQKNVSCALTYDIFHEWGLDVCLLQGSCLTNNIYFYKPSGIGQIHLFSKS